MNSVVELSFFCPAPALNFFPWSRLRLQLPVPAGFYPKILLQLVDPPTCLKLILMTIAGQIIPHFFGIVS